ncbi:calcineurin-like phosphoesterase superfamily domain protein [mine drainage metagenome]|uniref:Calcineurin-like phosphoesterase superfamily domain protein n=1 Tax=mine drainage metagenome TaxID=410659 RepID=A0A1J5S730_9ZZZZ
MKLHILSDLHFEFGKWPKSVDVNEIDADVTVLAGDIGVGLQGIQWALAIDRPVIYVMGNHEFYGQRPMDYLWRKAREKIADTHVHLLENESVLIDDPRHPGDRVRFFGAMLWTDFCILGAEQQEECMRHASQTMSDYSAMYVSRRGGVISEPGFASSHQGDRLTPRKTLSLHHESRDYLERELSRNADPFVVMDTVTKTVVVTHHAPSAKSLLDQQAFAYSDAAYASHLDHLVREADLWIHGHTHVPVDYRIGNHRSGRVVSNPRGYVGHAAVEEFDPSFVVEV